MMNRSVLIAVGAVWTVGLIVLGLWGWQRAEAIVMLMGWEKRTISAWSVRCAAAAVISAAEVLLMLLVVERVYRRDAFCGLVKLSALLALMVCTVSAVALGLAGR